MRSTIRSAHRDHRGQPTVPITVTESHEYSCLWNLFSLGSVVNRRQTDDWTTWVVEHIGCAIGRSGLGGG